MGLNKKNLLPYLESLEKENAIERAPYFLTDKFYKDTMLIARLFGESSRRLLRDRRDLILTNEVKTGFQRFDDPYSRSGKDKDTELRHYKFTKYKDFFLPKFNDRTLTEKNLFEFSNRIGAFIIRALIEAMNEENYSNKITDLVGEHAMSQEYVNNAMSRFIPHLIPAFKDLIENNTPSLTHEFYEDKEVTFYGWRCLECSSVTENADKMAVEQFIKNHQYRTNHSKGKWYKYDDDDSRKNSKLAKAKVKDSIWFVMRRKKIPGKFLFNDRISRKLVQYFNNIYGLSGYEFDS
jgi:hypothetical protein